MYFFPHLRELIENISHLRDHRSAIFLNQPLMLGELCVSNLRIKEAYSTGLDPSGMSPLSCSRVATSASVSLS